MMEGSKRLISRPGCSAFVSATYSRYVMNLSRAITMPTIEKSSSVSTKKTRAKTALGPIVRYSALTMLAFSKPFVRTSSFQWAFSVV